MGIQNYFTITSLYKCLRVKLHYISSSNFTQELFSVHRKRPLPRQIASKASIKVEPQISYETIYLPSTFYNRHYNRVSFLKRGKVKLSALRCATLWACGNTMNALGDPRVAFLEIKRDTGLSLPPCLTLSIDETIRLAAARRETGEGGSRCNTILTRCPYQIRYYYVGTMAPPSVGDINKANRGSVTRARGLISSGQLPASRNEIKDSYRSDICLAPSN